MNSAAELNRIFKAKLGTVVVEQSISLLFR